MLVSRFHVGVANVHHVKPNHNFIQREFAFVIALNLISKTSFVAVVVVLGIVTFFNVIG